MRRFGLLLATLLCLVCGIAWADDFTLPGLQADSDAYAQSLTQRFPAGGPVSSSLCGRTLARCEKLPLEGRRINGADIARDI